ncbi:MAG: chromosome partitioning protein ParB [Nostoc sp. RI_552]|nr:chromosome partitioning protein ParB [Nostoc sp. RI_552]
MTDFLMVDVASVNSSIPRSNFHEADLDILADKILESGGILKPLVLKKIGFEKYELLDGHFEYYAAVRAREKNPDEGEMVNAFIIPSEKEEAVLKQATILSSLNSSDKSVSPIPERSSSDSSRLTNLELRIEKQFNEFKSQLIQERQITDEKFKRLESKIPENSEENNPLKSLNTLPEDALFKKLQRSRISKAEKLAKAIVEARLKKTNQKFEDYRDVKKSVKGLGEQGILTIVDEW